MKNKSTSWRYIFCILLLTTLLQAQSEKPTLVVYAYASFAASWGPGPKIKAAFEKKYHCNLKFVTTSSAISALRKIQLEGKNTKADILMGLDKSSANIARKTHLFMEHGIDTSALSLPIAWHDTIFLPFDYSYFSFVYDAHKTHKVPHSFDALLKMPKDFKIIIEDPRSSTPGLGLLLWIKAVYGDKAGDYWRQLSPHILTITKSWSEAYGLFLKGEAAMVLSYTTSPAYHIIEEHKSNYKAAPFKNGHYAQIEVSALLKSSPHKALAKKFLAFTLSETFANIIPTTNWAYPVIKTKQGLPKGFESLYIPTHMLLLDDKEIETNKKHYLDEWLNAL
ncbi:thiamine ABC transporter substrate binding subunit [Sulfurospirillum sp. 1612]|uniref:thiamine ABC transporter substrate binding subunit n=1 Tax=Sulfurospirillum sp. 1612 TaxID=3094835 RepID=UPI002F943B89